MPSAAQLTGHGHPLWLPVMDSGGRLLSVALLLVLVTGSGLWSDLNGGRSLGATHQLFEMDYGRTSASDPLVLQSSLDRARTDNGNVCTEGAGCGGSRYRPHRKPRLAVRRGRVFRIETNLPARAVRVQLERPSADGTGPVFVESGPATSVRSNRRDRWIFALSHRRLRAVSTVTLSVDYGDESATYEAGLRVLR